MPDGNIRIQECNDKCASLNEQRTKKIKRGLKKDLMKNGKKRNIQVREKL